jgi:RecA/RadA recombinase
MSDKCLLRVEKLLKESSIQSAKKDDIINSIRIAQAQKKLTRIDEVNIDSIAKDVAEEIKIQKIKNKKKCY